jgi:hypothetical protein
MCLLQGDFDVFIRYKLELASNNGVKMSLIAQKSADVNQTTADLAGSMGQMNEDCRINRSNELAAVHIAHFNNGDNLRDYAHLINATHGILVHVQPCFDTSRNSMVP